MTPDERMEKINRLIDEHHMLIEEIAKKEIKSLDRVIAVAAKYGIFPTKPEEKQNDTKLFKGDNNE